MTDWNGGGCGGTMQLTECDANSPHLIQLRLYSVAKAELYGNVLGIFEEINKAFPK